jgi:hypothetical protein
MQEGMAIELARVCMRRIVSIGLSPTSQTINRFATSSTPRRILSLLMPRLHSSSAKDIEPAASEVCCAPAH